MHGFGGEGRQTDGDVLGSLLAWRAVAYPLASSHHDRLPSMDIESTIARLHSQHSPQDDGVLVELRCLARLDPTGRASHVGNAYGTFAAVGTSNVFVDPLGFVAGRLDARRLLDQGRHRLSPCYAF